MPQKLNNELFIEKAKIIHGNLYDYSLIDYKDTLTKIKIICPKHGVFEQTPNCHLRNRRCPQCFGNIKYTNEEFIEKCKDIYGNKYDYSLVNYNGNKKKVKTICKKHGIYLQRPDMLLQGHGCDKCSGTFKLTSEEFIEKSIKIHGNKYNYSLVEYINSHSKVRIICPFHGVFEQKPNSHLNFCGCPFCKSSRGEIKIKKFLDKNQINYIYQYKFNDCKYRSNLVFDFYIPEQKLCLEYDGLQHKNSIEHFGGEESFKQQKIKDNIKNKYCKNNNINLIRINYNKFNKIENILEKLIFIKI